MNLDDLIVGSDAFYERYVTDVDFRRKHSRDLTAELAAGLLRYTWEHHLKSEELPIPEFLSVRDVQSSIGDTTVYSALGVPRNNLTALLSNVLPEWGIMTSEKARLYIRCTSPGERKTLANAFFSGEHAEENACILIQEFVNASPYKDLPELISHSDIKPSVGDAVYSALGVPRSNLTTLLSKALPEWGIMTSEKARQYMSRTSKSERKTLAHAFFSGEHAEENARILIQEFVNTSPYKDLPELISVKDVQSSMGDTVYSALGVPRNNLISLLTKALPEWGVMTPEKAERYLNHTSLGEKQTLAHVFFSGEHAEENVRTYVQAYQLFHGKRLSDLTFEDYEKMPRNIRQSWIMQRSGKQELPKMDARYHVIQVRWTEAMARELESMLAGVEDGPEYLRGHVQDVWERLGVTTFAAQLKAQELGLIPETIIFRNGEKESFPSYPLVEFNGYPFVEYAFDTSLQSGSVYHVHLYQQPRNQEHLLVQVPFFFREEFNEYSPIEQHVMKAIWAYMRNANDFEKEQNTVNGRQTIWQMNAPYELSEEPIYVPLRAYDDRLTLIALRARYSLDPAGVQTAVIHTPNANIYLFRHREAGTIKE